MSASAELEPGAGMLVSAGHEVALHKVAQLIQSAAKLCNSAGYVKDIYASREMDNCS